MFNRILQAVCLLSISVILFVVVLGIWTDMDPGVRGKVLGTGFAVLLASGIMLMINLVIVKANAQVGKDRKRSGQ